MSGDKPKLHLLVKSAGVEKTYTHTAHEFVIGRSAEHADLAIEVSALSRKHLRLRIEGQALSVADLGSKNGTSLGGVELQPNQFMPLPIGSVLKLGKENDFLVVTQIETGEPTPSPDAVSEIIPFPVSTAETNESSRPLFSKKGRSRTKPAEPTLVQVVVAAPEVDRAKIQAKEIIQQAETISQELLLKSELRLSETETRLAQIELECRELETRAQNFALEIPKLETTVAQQKQQETELSQRLEVLGEETELFEKDLTELGRKYEEQNALVESKAADIARFEERLRAKQALVNTLDKKSNVLELKLTEDKRQHEGLVADMARLETESRDTTQTLAATNQQLETARQTLAQLVESHRLEEEAFSLSSRKIRAEFEAAKAEAELRKARLEVEIEEANGRRLVEQRTSGLARIERQEVEKHIAKGREEEARLRSENSNLESRIASGKLSVKNSEALTVAAQNRLNELHTEKQTLERRMRDDELHRAALLGKAEKTAEAIVTDSRLKADRQTAQRRGEEELKHADFMAQLESERLRKAQAIENEMATLRLKATEEVARLRTDFFKSRDRKKKLEISEITRAVGQIVEIRTGAQLEDDISEVVKSVVESVWNSNSNSAQAELSDFAAVNPGASAQRRKFWLSLVVRAIFGLAFIGVAAAIPTMISFFRDNFHAEKAKGEAASVALAEKAQQARASRLFHPDRTVEYRPSYWENLIYADRYLELKSDVDLQKRWVLALNKYFIKNFDSNDRLIVEFISQEKALILQLMPLVAVLNVDALESGLVHLKQLEIEANIGFLKVFKTNENYKKFREFEKDFYLANQATAKSLTEKPR